MYADLNLQMLRNLKRGWLNFDEYNQPVGHSLHQIIICNIKTAMVDFNSKNFILTEKKKRKKNYTTLVGVFTGMLARNNIVLSALNTILLLC